MTKHEMLTRDEALGCRKYIEHGEDSAGLSIEWQMKLFETLLAYMDENSALRNGQDVAAQVLVQEQAENARLREEVEWWQKNSLALQEDRDALRAVVEAAKTLVCEYEQVLENGDIVVDRRFLRLKAALAALKEAK